MMESKIVYSYVSDKASEVRKTRHYKNMDSAKRIGCDLLYGSICIIEGAQYLLNVAAESLYKMIERIVGGGH